MLSKSGTNPRRLWIFFISNLIWIFERVLFYPKLARAYKELNLSEPKGGLLLIFDFGANKGQSIKFFTSLYPKSKIYAFEPSAKIFKTLEVLKEKIASREVFIFQIGLGHLQGTINFYESALDETSTFALPSQSSEYLKKKNQILFQKPENAFIATTAKIVRFDDFCKDKKICYVDILKIDVEGFEFEVLSGAEQALMHGDINVIQIERHKDDMRVDNFLDIHKLLMTHKYLKVKEIKHPFGNFIEILYQHSSNVA